MDNCRQHSYELAGRARTLPRPADPRRGYQRKFLVICSSHYMRATLSFDQNDFIVCCLDALESLTRRVEDGYSLVHHSPRAAAV